MFLVLGVSVEFSWANAIAIQIALIKNTFIAIVDAIRRKENKSRYSDKLDEELL